jgi:hypothetical protein
LLETYLTYLYKIVVYKEVLCFHITIAPMMLRLKRVMICSAVSLQLIGFFIPQLSQAQENGTTTNPNILQPPEDAVEDSIAQTSTEFRPDPAVPNTEPVSGSAGGSMLRNLLIFGQGLGMDAVDPRIILARIIRMALSFIGIIVLVLILWSGLRYMTAGGDEEKAASARKTFFNTLIGLFIILAAYSIVTFVLRAFSASNTSIDPVATPVSPNVSDPVVNP